MDKKVFRMIIITLIALIITSVLIIFRLIDMQKNEKNENPEVTKDVQLEETPVDDPVEGDFKVHKSENGYTVKYPAGMQATKLARSIDFILEDEESKSTINIVTAKNDGTLHKMSREEFEYSLSQTSEEAVLISYEDIKLNGADAVEAVFSYMDNEIKQIIIITENMGYNISVTKGANISDEMSVIFDDVVNSFVLN